MTLFTPNFTVIHNGKTLTAGSPVEVADKDAEELEQFGTIVKTEPVAKPVQKAGPKPTKTARAKKEQATVIDEDDDIL